ncbi:MAG: sporulation-like protein [Cycloclasticus sp. symbiont of Poecilosclerida sp. M]|nr:MAG: sporulation-like protein [Cycloclasticus sp. symbiont of Poecilosclerida sp. M]
MARDYKNKLQPKVKQSNSVQGWLWLLAGLVIGGFVMFLSELAKQTPSQASPPTTKPIVKNEVRDVKKTAEPDVQTTIKSTKPRFDFYTILPEMEVVIPENEINERRRQEGTGTGKIGPFMIQIGSFQKLADADSLKARLALLGVESHIEVVERQGTTWHRVKSGPFANFSGVDKTQNILHRNQINSIVLKVN